MQNSSLCSCSGPNQLAPYLMDVILLHVISESLCEGVSFES